MPRESRRSARAHLDLNIRVERLEEDVDNLEDDQEAQKRRTTQLLVAASGLLVSVCTAIIMLFITGVISP